MKYLVSLGKGCTFRKIHAFEEDANLTLNLSNKFNLTKEKFLRMWPLVVCWPHWPHNFWKHGRFQTLGKIFIQRMKSTIQYAVNLLVRVTRDF